MERRGKGPADGGGRGREKRGGGNGSCDLGREKAGSRHYLRGRLKKGDRRQRVLPTTATIRKGRRGERGTVSPRGLLIVGC